MVGIVANEFEVDRDRLGLEQQGGARDRQFADAAGTEAAADHQTLRVPPILVAQEAADDQGELLREFLDRTLHQAGRGRLALVQQGGQFLLADAVAGFVAERIFAQLLQGLAPLFQDFPERVFAGPVANKALIVLDLEIVAVDADAGQHLGAVGRKLELVVGFFGHRPCDPKRQSKVNASAEPQVPGGASRRRRLLGPLPSPPWPPAAPPGRADQIRPRRRAVAAGEPASTGAQAQKKPVLARSHLLDRPALRTDIRTAACRGTPRNRRRQAGRRRPWAGRSSCSMSAALPSAFI